MSDSSYPDRLPPRDEEPNRQRRDWIDRVGEFAHGIALLVGLGLSAAAIIVTVYAVLR